MVPQQRPVRLIGAGPGDDGDVVELPEFRADGCISDTELRQRFHRREHSQVSIDTAVIKIRGAVDCELRLAW